jgi:hypothetical protein
LLSKLEPLVEGGGSMAQAAAYACTEAVNSPAVQEDYELCGFTPLHTKHSMLHFSDHHLTDPGSSIPADQWGRNETARRVTRIFASAYEIATYPDPLHNLPPIQLNPNTGVFTGMSLVVVAGCTCVCWTMMASHACVGRCWLHMHVLDDDGFTCGCWTMMGLRLHMRVLNDDGFTCVCWTMMASHACVGR